jgi:alkanesulfonate monooxygenase SsuD/methylene tetrahydromethanopterin reductase-like flavin-dependent oxidoreductase (luciferase family)
MLKFTAHERAALVFAAAEAEAIHAEFEDLAAQYNADIAALVERFGDATDIARGIVEDAASAADEYFDLKSEKWQEGDRGQAYQEWQRRLQDVADAIGERIDAEEPNAPELPDWIGDLGDEEFLEFTY